MARDYQKPTSAECAGVPIGQRRGVSRSSIGRLVAEPAGRRGAAARAILVGAIGPALALGCIGDGTSPRGNPAVRVVVGALHSCALMAGGEAYCWGNDAVGQLGRYTNHSASNPYPIRTSAATYAALAAGAYHTCALASDGRAYCWGMNTKGQLGTGDTTNRFMAAPVAQGALVFTAIAAGGNRTCALTASGQAYCWGSAAGAVTGGGPPGNASIPVPVSGSVAFRSVTLSFSHTCGLDASSVGYCWGNNGRYELGVGDTLSRWVPTRVGGSLTFRTMAAGSGDTCALTSAGAPYCWGTVSPGLPALVLGGFTFADLSNGDIRACAITRGAAGYCWGIPQVPPAAVPLPIPGALRWRTISAGDDHSCGVTTEGAVYCWGEDGNGQLGDGSYGPGASSDVPVRTQGLQ